jgi:hypothetical protein
MIGIVALLAAGLWTLYALLFWKTTELPGPITFQPDLTPATIGTKLAPFLVIAVLIERTIQVFFGLWIEPEEHALDMQAERANRALATLDSEDTIASRNAAAALLKHESREPAALRDEAKTQLQAASDTAAEIKQTKTRVAFLLGGSLGLLVALAGARMLGIIVKFGSPIPRHWIALDVLLTAGLLGGGADGFNHLTSTLAAYLETLKKKAESR